MRVLQVIDKSFLGGGQTVVRHLLEGFRGTDVESLLACRDGGPLVEAARALGTRVHTIPFDKRFRPSAARRVADLVRSERVDVVHAHGLVAATTCWMARRLFGARVPLLYHQHGFHHHNYGPLTIGLRRAAEKAICRRVDRVIPVSSADLALLSSGGYAPRERLELVYYGIPEPRATAEEIEGARRAARLEPGRPVVGLVGRLHVQKGVDVFLAAAALVHEARPDAQIVVVGEGELETELHEQGRRLGLKDAVRWTGGRPSAPFMPLFSVAVLSSRWEGLPLVLLEYMARSLPIVTTDAEGCLDAVGETEARIVPRDDPRAMADAILGLLGDPVSAHRLGESARARFDGTFDIVTMTRRFESIYREVLR
ncbi:MAG TPA: glycosyltransferase family 4 protein [Thermoanaerobaculia bacterium]|nr:glycosyltransferase family 4 protein [Thermoanaerobaculia bacterium]HPA51854.1 glycosyltransferase family 4 protein [Thermoanaerobaculia bacterium]HQN07756.1 glycosyltransferase family 4 protein [Thermoanaerobaculia bacterium]HQP85461.1 glycosyltransferase family 4 protein [Thermoanaerobaculia bacterium]